MDTRLARMIAQSTTDGKLDRARLYDALSLSPDDPLTLVVEAVLGVDQGIERQKQQDAGHATALTAVFNENCEQLKVLLANHVEQVESAKEQLAIMTEELSVARAEVRAKLAVETDALTKNSAELVTLAREMREASTKNGKRLLIFTLAGFFAGAAGALLFVLIRLH